MNQEFNFLEEGEKQPQKRTFKQKYQDLLKKYRRTKHAVTGLLVIVFILGVIFGTMSVYYINIIAQAKEETKTAFYLWQDDRYAQSKESALKAKRLLEKLQSLLDHEYLFKVPVVGNKLESGEEVVDSSISAFNSYANLIDILEEMQDYGDISYEEIKDKQETVNLIGSLLREVENIFFNIEVVSNEAKKAGVANWPVIRDALQELDQFGDQDMRTAGVFYPALEQKEMTYLLLMQNNRKLMPTGGYIGNFGILKVKTGEVVDFHLMDTPKFDRENKSPIAINPPEPLRDYYGKTQWELTDANWSPSFPLTARRAQALYKAQGGEEDIDGVIAFSPDVVIDWLDMVGGVTVDDIEYNSENFPNTPQYIKECADGKACGRTKLVGGRTIEGSDRKYIINPIAQEVKNKLVNLPLKSIVGAMNLLVKNVEEQNLFIYFNDAQLQQHVIESGFAGDLLPSEQDYLMVVDSNLSTARLDQYVERKMDYVVNERNGKITAKVTLNYRYKEEAREEDPTVPAYRNYFRVFAPLGSKIINSSAKFDSGEELGMAVFGSFISLNPGQEKKIELTYELPESVIKDGEYKLVMQKQLGNVYLDYSVNITLADKIKEYSPKYCEFCPEENSQIIWQGRMEEDIEFIVKK